MKEALLRFVTTLKKFGQKGEKTGWTYLEISSNQASTLKSGYKKSFRVKGSIDATEINQLALIPMGNGRFILPINASLRKKLRKIAGAKVQVCLQLDESKIELPADFLECMEDEPAAKDFFFHLPKSHQTYFGKWITSAKTEPTQAKRIAIAIDALSRKMGFGEMIRARKTSNSLRS